MKRIILALVVSFWIVNTAAYAQELPQKPSDSAKESYKIDDEKMKELRAQHEEGVKLREELDINKDGSIDESERAAYREKMLERYKIDDEKMKELGAQHEEGVKLREELDKNKNNAPKIEELKNAYVEEKTSSEKPAKVPKESVNNKGGIFSDDKAKNKKNR